MEFNFPPQNLAEVFGFFAVMFIVMLAFYFFGQWLHKTGHGPHFHIPPVRELTHDNHI